MKKRNLHIAIIIIGIIFISLGIFHSSIWFDESYSVAIAKHNLIDIWNITGNDVHPALYYWMLHFLYLIFGNNVLVYRIFSALGFAILGIIGFTHIRKDFGENTGILFSFLTYFLPIVSFYAEEIRMYSWACLFVVCMAIYAYRFYKDKNLKNLILFGIFSLASCYIHYYSLVTACLVNLVLLIYLIKNRKEYKKALRNFLILAVIQIILYIPWLIYLISQVLYVEKEFWVKNVGIFDTIFGVLSFQFQTFKQSDVILNFNFKTILAIVAAVIFYIYSRL